MTLRPFCQEPCVAFYQRPQLYRLSMPNSQSCPTTHVRGCWHLHPRSPPAPPMHAPCCRCSCCRLRPSPPWTYPTRSIPLVPHTGVCTCRTMTTKPPQTAAPRTLRLTSLRTCWQQRRRQRGQQLQALSMRESLVGRPSCSIKAPQTGSSPTRSWQRRKARPGCCCLDCACPRPLRTAAAVAWMAQTAQATHRWALRLGQA